MVNNGGGPGGSDKALLDRLNALKPTNVALDSTAATSITPASTIERAKPPLREDALSDRLKSLRGQIVDEPDSTKLDNSTTNKSTAAKHAGSNIQYTTSSAATPSKDVPVVTPRGGLRQTIIPAGTSEVNRTGAATTDNTEEDADDPLLSMTDDQTLEDLLADLESDQQWLKEMAAAEEEEQHRRAIALLEELSPDKGNARDDSKDASKHHSNGDNKNEDSDDSDGEVMTREADDLVAKALDEVELDRWNTGSSSPPAQDGELPSTDKEDDFTASIASRMAALNVSRSTPTQQSTPTTAAALPSVPATEPDPFAAMLPSAPTQDPATKPAVVTGVLRKSARRGGAYTDEDQKSWCTVCLDDGTMRCLGCDDDGAGGNIYCERCWREMHVGPMAGFDDLGHKWEKFERGR